MIILTLLALTSFSYADMRQGSAPVAASSPVPSTASEANAKSAHNLGLVTSVGSNALTIALKQADGSTNPSTGTSAVKIGIRGATAATGSASLLSFTGATSIVVPSGATLGHASATSSYVFVYVVDGSSADEMCVSGVDLFDDAKLQSATAITDGADSGTVLYCTSAHTSRPIRYIGRALVSETTAGTWASNATEVSLLPERKITTLENQTCTATQNMGSNANVTCRYNRRGRYAEVMFSVNVTGNTDDGITLRVSLPAALTIHTALLPNTDDIAMVLGNGFARNAGVQNFPVSVQRIDSANDIFFTDNATAATVVSNSVPFDFQTGDSLTGIIHYPVLGWSDYGP